MGSILITTPNSTTTERRSIYFGLRDRVGVGEVRPVRGRLKVLTC